MNNLHVGGFLNERIYAVMHKPIEYGVRCRWCGGGCELDKTEDKMICKECQCFN